MRKKVGLFLVLILILSMSIVGCGKKKEEVKKEENVINVESGKVERKSILMKTIISGKLMPIEEANVVSKMMGKVVSTNNLEIGKKVNKGDVLFTLDQKDLLNGVRNAEAAYNTALVNMNKAVEQINNAKVNYERMKSLYEQGAISKQQFEQSELSASTTNIDVAKSQVDQARVALENAKSGLSDTTVVAPISGVITSVNIHNGEVASSGVPALTIANLDKVTVDLNISENIINKIKIGDLVDISIKSANKDFKGKVTNLSPAPAGNSMTYPIKIEIDNKDKIIKPGMFADVSIVTDKRENVLAVKSQDPIVKEGNTVVFIIDDKGKAHMTKVTLGMDNGEYVEITNGLKEGEIVVEKGQTYLEEGSKVKNKK